MASICRPCRISIAIIIATMFFICGLSSRTAADTKLKLEISQNRITPDDTLTYFDFYLDNPEESVAAFEINISLSSSDFGSFKTIDPAPGPIDTTGSIISYWAYLNVKQSAGSPPNLQIVGMAYTINPPFEPPLGPQSGGLLFRIPFAVDQPFPEMSDSVLYINISESLENTGFSDPSGYLIGIVTDTLIDTLWYACEAWDEDSCISWVQVDSSIADTSIVDSSLNSYYDESAVFFINGSLTVMMPLYGDANGDESVNIVDASFIINFIFFNGAEPQPYENGDANYDESVNIADAAAIVYNIFGD